MPVLICEKCNVYYELDNESDAKDFGNCECGDCLVYFDNLTDYYSAYEKCNEVERDSIANGLTYTEKQVIKFKNKQKEVYYLNNQLIGQYKNNEDFWNNSIIICIGIFILDILLLILNFISYFLGFIIIICCFIYLIREFDKYLNRQRFKKHLYAKNKSLYKKKNSSLNVKDLSWYKGLEGENLVLNYLNTLPKDYFVFNDVNLPGKKGNIDHVVIGPNGIFTIETKNYGGKYYIKGNQWFYYKDGEYKKINYNPGSQVIKNTMDIKGFLKSKGIYKSIWIESIVAFINDDFIIKGESTKYKILAPETVPEYILNYKRRQDIEILKKAAEELEPYCTELTFARK